MSGSSSDKMRHQIAPEKSTWDRFWTRERTIDEVYHNDDRIPVNLRRVMDVNGKKILEVGAGTGRDSLELQKLGAEIYILDYVRSSLSIVHQVFQKNQQPVHLILADGTLMPFSNDSFDVVFHQGLLEHFRDPLPLLFENIRVLKPGGMLLVDVPQKYHLYTIIKHVLIWMGKWFAGWETEFSIGELQSLLERKNLTVIHKYGSWMNPSLVYRMFREIFLRLGIKLPLYPKPLWFLGRIRRIIKERMLYNPLSFYTFMCIGVIAKKTNLSTSSGE